MKISELIKSKRKEKNLTQQELADLLFVSSKTISKWETGRGLPEVMMLNKIAEILNIDSAEMMGSIKDSSEKSDIKHGLVIKNSMYISLIVAILGATLFISGGAIYSRYDEWTIFIVIIGALCTIFSIPLFFILINKQQLKYGIEIRFDQKYVKIFLFIQYVIFFISIVTEIFTHLLYGFYTSEITIMIMIQLIIITLIYGISNIIIIKIKK